MIGRPQLCSRLDEGSDLTLLCAPTGTGKTTLLTQWCATEPGGVTIIWVHSHPSASADLALSRARRELAQGNKIALVVERLNQLPAAMDIELARMAGHQQRVRVVASVTDQTRADHLLAQVTHRSTTVIRGAEMQFTDTETAQVFAEHDVVLGPEDLTAIRTWIGGWPALTAALARLAGTYPIGPELHKAATTLALSMLDDMVPGLRAARTGPGPADLALPEAVTGTLADAFGGAEMVTTLQGLAGDGVVRASAECPSPVPRPTADDSTTVYTFPSAVRAAMIARSNATTAPTAGPPRHRVAHHHDDRNRPDLALSDAVRGSRWMHAREIIEQHWGRLLMQHRTLLSHSLNSIPLPEMTASNTAMAVRSILLDTPDQGASLRTPLPPDTDDLVDAGRSTGVAALIEESLAVMVALRHRR